jgi:hypothetical protein
MLVVFLAVFAFVLWKIFNAVKSGGDSSSGSADFRSDKPYERKYECSREVEALPSEQDARGGQQGMPACKFLLTAKKHLARDYVLIIDRSGSMSGRNWAQAEQSVKQLAPYICRFDPDGVDLYFFDHDFVKISNVKSAQEVGSLFDTYRPRGSTDLARVLHAAFADHFAGTRGATTILVVTDGAPNSKPEVERVIKRAAGSMERDAELSVSFIQVGNDSGATRFLQRLDDDLSDAKFDIVDTLTTAQCKTMSFNELIANSIYD